MISGVQSTDVVIVGAGQAGLSLSYELSQAGIDHLVLERGRVGESWRGRWDGFCLVLPNWTVQLPGKSYSGDDPDGFMPRDEIVDYLVEYAASFGAPVREEVEVYSLGPNDHERFLLRTSFGGLSARRVVLASGGYQRPYRPPASRDLGGSLYVIDAETYAHPDALPDGEVLVVGSGQTGCQLAEELVESGRSVHLACGRAPWVPRRLSDRDIIAWMNETPFMDARLSDLPSPLARLAANPQATGRRGGHDLHYRTLQGLGVNLLGHLAGVEDGIAHFAADLDESVAFGDARYADLCALIARSCVENEVNPPDMPSPPPFIADPVEALNLSSFGSVIFTCGFRPDYKSWVEFPDAFDDLGFPFQEDGSSTVIEGLHFMGVHFQRKRKSANFLGVAEDAAVLGEKIATSSCST
jgi:putative flavoprotein involved in K+ transport